MIYLRISFRKQINTFSFIINYSMSGPFQGSRLSNLREKRTPQNQNHFVTKQQEKPFALQLDDEPGYMPSISVQGGRTATRFLKGRIQKPSNPQIPNSTTANNPFSYKENNNNQRKPSMKLNQPEGEFKLVLNDSPVFEKKKSQIKMIPQQPPQKRILIQKKQEKQQPPAVKQQIKPEPKQQVKVIKAPVNKVEEQVISVKPKQQGEIKQEEIEESGLPNQNQLVQCTEGCGRKFNRKALEKHAKACKLVFMSKRKQFNSEAKRLTSHEQAALIKQNKLQEKKAQMGMTKGKGFQKTGENWKAASQDFRSALKAIKKQGAQKQGEQEELKTVACEYCQKQFAEVLLVKHLQNCVKRREKQLKDRKKAGKKK